MLEHGLLWGSPVLRNTDDMRVYALSKSYDCLVFTNTGVEQQLSNARTAVHTHHTVVAM